MIVLFVAVYLACINFLPADFGSTSELILGFSLIVVYLSMQFLLSKNRLSAEDKFQIEKGQDEFWGRWYIRLLNATFMIAIAFSSFHVWASGGNAKGIFILLVNPITPLLLGGLAILVAWEFSLITIILAIIFFVFVGLASLPISLAIIIGFSILAWGVANKKA